VREGRQPPPHARRAMALVKSVTIGRGELVHIGVHLVTMPGAIVVAHLGGWRRVHQLLDRLRDQHRRVRLPNEIETHHAVEQGIVQRKHVAFEGTATAYRGVLDHGVENATLRTRHHRKMLMRRRAPCCVIGRRGPPVYRPRPAAPDGPDSAVRNPSTYRAIADSASDER
jgi:hypothetical protein